jgi:hypothetical protein
MKEFPDDGLLMAASLPALHKVMCQTVRELGSHLAMTASKSGKGPIADASQRRYGAIFEFRIPAHQVLLSFNLSKQSRRCQGVGIEMAMVASMKDLDNLIR